MATRDAAGQGHESRPLALYRDCSAVQWPQHELTVMQHELTVMPDSLFGLELPGGLGHDLDWAVTVHTSTEPGWSWRRPGRRAATGAGLGSAKAHHVTS